MLEYMLVITSTQKHGCPSKGTPWALCTQPRPAVWGDFTPVLLIIHTSGPPYFHMHIDMTAIGVDFSVTYGPWVWTYGCKKLICDVNLASGCYFHSSMRIHNGVNALFTPISAHCDHLS